jgi:methionyl-tRNA synthetase
VNADRPAAAEPRGRFYLTTPIYYVNDAPHIGHAYTTVIGDAVARWHRLLGDEAFYLTGTDEHGLKVQRAAEANGVSPREWADRTVERFRDAWKLLNISNDDFIRTTEPRHYEAVTKILQAVKDNGYIELGVYEGLYCVACEAYYTADELVDDGLCPIHHRPVEQVREENYFFKLSAFDQRLLDWYEAHPGFVQPESKRNEALGFIRQGLQDFSISRTSITWGVPLPWDPSHVTYVWFDALTNYITAVGYGDDEARFEKWWPATHLIGKDILRFHCVYWPAMLMAAGLEPPANIHVHGFLLVGGEKMSKTKLNQIAPDELVAEFGVDGFRYHFLRDTPFGPDGDFSYERMIERYNADLANNLGNLLSRVATVVGKKCGGIGPGARPDSPLAAVAADAYQATAAAWANVQPSLALEATWRLVRETNAFLEANEPWKMESGEALDGVMGDALEALRIVALLASPALPATCDELWQRIGLLGKPSDQRLPEAAVWGGYLGGAEVTKGAALFPRLQPS